MHRHTTYTHIYIYIYIYIYTIYIYICIHTHMYTYVYTCIRHSNWTLWEYRQFAAVYPVGKGGQIGNQDPEHAKANSDLAPLNVIRRLRKRGYFGNAQQCRTS